MEVMGKISFFWMANEEIIMMLLLQSMLIERAK